MLLTLIPTHEALLPFKIPPITELSFSSTESPSSTVLSSQLPSLSLYKSVSISNLPLLFSSTRPASLSVLPLLAPLSPLDHPNPCNLDPPWDIESPALPWHGDSLAVPHPSKPSAPPCTIDQSAPPWLLAPSALPETVIPLAPPGSLVPQAAPVIVTSSPRTSGAVCCSPALYPYGSVGLLHPSSFTKELAHTSIASVHRPQATPRSLVAGTAPWSLCPSMSLGLLAHRTSPGTHYLPASPPSVGLKFQPWFLPPSVPPWVIFLLAASRCALDSRWPYGFFHHPLLHGHFQSLLHPGLSD